MNILSIIFITCLMHQQGAMIMEHPIGPSFVSMINTKQKIYYNNLGIRLDCLAKGNPLPMITWFRRSNNDDQLLTLVQSSELIDLYENGSLFIRPFREYVKSIHAGSFICQAENPAGSIQSLPIQLKPQMYDAYEIEVKNPYGFIQSSVIISCEISPPIASSYVSIVGWLEKIDSQVIQLDLYPRTKYHFLPNKNLIIHNLTKSDDHRSYACVIRNEIDNNTRQSPFKILRVREPSPFGPELSVPNNTNYHAQSGDLIELPCGIASISTNARISWRKDGMEVKDMRERIYQTSLTIQLSSSLADDGGVYACQVDDESSGKMTSMLTLKATLPIKCQFNIHQTNIHAGSNSELTCTTNTLTILPIQWQWYHNSHPLATTSNRYSIVNATRKHMGMYQCCLIPSISNLNGCCAQTQIRIINSSPFLLSSDPTHVHSIIISPKTISPSSIDLNCTVYGDPIPELTIYKDGQRLSLINRMKYLPTGDVSLHYPISIMNINDTGLYECLARNSFGSISLSKHINIENQRPSIQPLANQTIRLDEPFTLRCYASGQPNLYLQWIDETTHQIINTSSTSPILFTSTATQSTGYICQARNPYGEISARMFLTIENPGRILSITPNQTIKIYERLNIFCFVEGDQYLELILKTPSIEKRYENRKNISIIIEHIEMIDSGLYECSVKNNYSEQRAIFEIIVENRPDRIEHIFLENSERIFWFKPFDGHSPILQYILRIQYKQGLSWSNETIITIDQNDITSYSFDKISSKCLISVIIQASNRIGTSLPSDPLYFQTNIKQLPIAPSNLTANNISSKSMILTWQYPSFDVCSESLLKFVIEITDQYNQTRIQSYNYHSRIAIINQLKSFTYYTVLIYAINDFGSSPKSQSWKIQPNEDVPLAMIVHLTSRLLNTSTASVTWTFPDNAYPFLNGQFRTFAVSIYENFNMSTLTTIETINTYLVLNHLHSSSRYFISISVCNYHDCGPSSSAIDIKTPSLIFGASPAMPQTINRPSSIQAKIHYLTSDEIGLKMVYPFEIIENVIINYKLPNSSLLHHLNISPPLINIRLTNLSCGNLYEIMIYASNQIGLSSMEYLRIKTSGSVPMLIDSKDLFETISHDYIILNMNQWLINACPILSYEIEFFPLSNTSEIRIYRYISSINSIRIANLRSNHDYQLNIKIHSEAGENLQRIFFRTKDSHHLIRIKHQQMIFIMISLASFLITLTIVLFILKKTELFDQPKTRFKPALYSSTYYRPYQKSSQTRSDSFASEDSHGNINPYAVSSYQHCQTETTDICLSMAPSSRYFYPIMLESSSSSSKSNQQKSSLTTNLSTVSSSADSGVHSSYTHSPRCPLHNILSNEIPTTYEETHLPFQQYSLV